MFVTQNGVLPESGFWSILAVAHSKQLLKVQTVVESILADVELGDEKASKVRLHRVTLIPIPKILIPAKVIDPVDEAILEDEFPLYLNDDTLIARRLFSYFGITSPL